MATFGIRDPRIAQGFSSLANAFLPRRVDPAQQAQIEANAQRAELLRAQAQAERFQLQSATEIDSLFSMDPAMRDERWRGRLAGAMSGMEGGLQYGPGFLTGATTFMEPQGLNESDLSNVLVGTGVVNSFGQTPEGQRRALEGNIDVQRVRNEAPGSRGAGRQPRVVSQTALNHMTRAATARLAQAYGVKPDRLALDPILNDMLQSTIASKYAQSGDASMAVFETLDELTASAERTDGWLTSDAYRLSPGADAIPGFTGSGPLPDDADQIPENIGSPEGTIIEAEDGSGLKLVKRGGQWVPLDG